MTTICQAMLTTTERPRALTGPDPRPHAVVIGSGFGGLAAAIRLGAAATGSRCWKSSTTPGGRAACLPAGRLHLRRRPDDRHRALPVRGALDALRPPDAGRHRPQAGHPVLRHRLSRRRGVPRVRAIPPPCAPRSRSSRRATSPATTRFAKRSAEIYSVGFEELGDQPVQLDHGHGAGRARPAAARGLSQRLFARVALLHATSGCARRSASIRCSSAATRSGRARSTA